MQRSWSGVSIASALLGLAGCAASIPETTSTANLLTPVVATSSSPLPGPSKAGGYVLSADEQNYECKQLSGRMQIRILEIRDYNERSQTSKVSQALKSAVTPFFGGGTHGTDPGGDYAKDRAMLEAYNTQLAAKGCKTYNLDAELKPKDFRETPTVVTPPTDKKKSN
jgi:hypothetical protein